MDLGQDYFETVEYRWKPDDKKDINDKFGTILPYCNETLEGGHNRKELCMVVAPPGVGKSLFLVNQAKKSLYEGRKVLYVTLEMSEHKVGKRLDAVISRLPYNTLKDPPVQDTLIKRMNKFKEVYPESKLVIKEFPSGLVNTNSIRSLINQIWNKHGWKPDVVVVDYLELLGPIDRDWETL